MLARLSQSLSRRSHNIAPAVSPLLNEVVSSRGVDPHERVQCASNPQRILAHFLSNVAAKHREDLLENDDHVIKEAVKRVMASDENETGSKGISDEELRRRLDAFQDLFAEARLCIDDCRESVETTYFDEEADAAKDAVEEACAAYADILDDLDTEERERPGTSSKRSNQVRRSNGLKVEQLKGELALIIGGGSGHD